MKVLILKPRLDLPFKKFSAAMSDPNLPEIRTYWDKFCTSLKVAHEKKHDAVFVVEAPRWQFANDIVNEYNADVTYVPHTEKERFHGQHLMKPATIYHGCMYYMQTVFPELFTIDPVGWGGGASFAKTVPEYVSRKDDDIFKQYQERIKNNESKFDQPKTNIRKIEYHHDDFIFVPLQLPHDETIKYHSKLGVCEFVRSLCEWSLESDVPIVFKGHPVNLPSMEPLKEIIEASSARVSYVDDVSIHAVIPKCTAVYLINSGVGMEAMLHEKPVVSFGKSEYQHFVIKGDIKDLSATWADALHESTNKDALLENYKKFFNWYVGTICYNCNDINYFRLP